MPDTDPPDEVDDIPTPHHRVHIAPDTHTRGDLPTQHEEQHAKAAEAENKRNPPPERRFTLANGRNPIRNPSEATLVGDQRDALQFSWRLWNVCWYGCGGRHYEMESCNVGNLEIWSV